MIFSAPGFSGTASPFLSPREMSSMRKMSAGRQTPEKSILPPGSRGAGPEGVEGNGFRFANEFAFPEDRVFEGAGAWARPENCVQRQIRPVASTTLIELAWR